MTDHVTAVSVVPLTVAENWRVKPACTVAEEGEINTEIADGDGLTVTVALADLLGSALLTAVIVTGPEGAAVGAV